MKRHLKSITDSCNNIPSQSQIADNLQGLATLLSVIDTHENSLQATREVMALRPDFNPQTLFQYLTNKQSELTKKHLLTIAEDNDQFLHEEQLKLIFSTTGGKDKQKMTYATFLNFIYPHDVDTIRQISTVNAKKYAKNINQPLNQELLCLFLMVLKGEVNFIKQFQTIKCEILPSLTREKIKRMIKEIKKSSENIKGNSEFKSSICISTNEMKTFLKKMKKTPQNRINSVCRRLSMGSEEGIVTLEQFQFWLKSWNKIKNEDGSFFEKETIQKTLFEDISSQLEEINS